jgi:hypothetical protein
MRTVVVRMIGTSLAAAQVMRNEGQSDVDVDSEDTEDEDGKGDCGGDAGKQSQRNSNNEEKWHDKGVDGVEERHGRLAGHGHEQKIRGLGRVIGYRRVYLRDKEQTELEDGKKKDGWMDMRRTEGETPRELHARF